MSLLYECINGIVQGGILDGDDTLREKDEIAYMCVEKLRGMIVTEADPNRKRRRVRANFADANRVTSQVRWPTCLQSDCRLASGYRLDATRCHNGLLGRRGHFNTILSP